MNTETVANPPANTERRKFGRKTFRGEIDIEWGSATLKGIVRDIGPQGLFIELAEPLWIGATFLARLVMDPVLRLDCVVRRVEPGKGMAVTFKASAEGGKAQLEGLLASLSQA